MTQRVSFVRRDLLVLLIYLGCVVLVQIVETKLLMPTAAMAVYLVGSGAYVVSLVMMHRVARDPGVSPGPRLKFVGICLAFIVLGLFLGLVIGVNAKFLLGGTL
jgi:hypothetical protein